MRILFSLLLYALISISPAVAGEADEVQALLKDKVDGVVALLQDQALDKERRNDRIVALVTPIFDYPTMAKLSLGKKHWPGLTPLQQEQFTTLFTLRLQESYLEKLDLYSDEQILYEAPQVKGQKIHLPTTLVSKDSRIAMLYKFYRSAPGWKIYDVEIGGVSVIQTYRSQFDGVLQEGTVDDLLDKLKLEDSFTISPAGEEARKGGN